MVPNIPLDSQTLSEWYSEYEELQKMEENLWHGRLNASYAHEVIINSINN
jgi:hypothetical protein